MRQFSASTIESYLYLCMKLRGSGQFWMFRGQRDATWDVRTHVVDESFCDGDYIAAARMGLDVFRRSVESTEECLALGTDPWKWLFFAQHKGVPTPLLDWSSNPLVALYFAVEDILAERVLPGRHGAVFPEAENMAQYYKTQWKFIASPDLGGEPWRIRGRHAREEIEAVERAFQIR